MRCRLSVAVLATLACVAVLAMGAPASATCTPNPVVGGATTTCSGTTYVSVALGSGLGGPDSATVLLLEDATLIIGNANAISLRDGATITLEKNSAVTNSASASTPATGMWNAGANTIEFGSNGILTIGAGAKIAAQGAATNAMAIEIFGAGNQVENSGLIDGGFAAAIWFGDKTVGAANKIDNYGTIQTNGGMRLANVIGSSGNGPVIFTNRSGGRVYGSLNFAGGNDQLTLYANSVITGTFNGGGGTNNLTLNGDEGSSDVLAGDITNFQTLTKDGLGMWSLSGIVGNNGGTTSLVVDVKQGTLALTGNNSSWKGTVLIEPDGILKAPTQSLPAAVAVTDNGLLWFAQPANGAYSNVISGTGAVSKTEGGTLTLSAVNSYAGGTVLGGGTLSVGADANLGAAAGPLTFSGGTLLLTNSFDMPDRKLSITEDNGAISTDTGVVTAIAQAISGTGALTKAGPGLLTLAGANSYAGDTTIAAGTLQLGNGGSSGSIASANVVDNGTLAFNRADQVTFNSVISGAGSVEQNGAGVTIFGADNSYSGTTRITNGWLYINGDQSAATGALTAEAGTRLGGSGTIGGNVAMAANSTLAPGAAPTLAGTLTINGDLTLNANSSLFYNLQQAGVAGGQLNDLTVVTGKLDLAGTINLAYNGEPLGPGVYRLFDYGTLSCGGQTCDGSNGLKIGDYLTVPTSPQDSATVVGPMNTKPTDFLVQLSVAGQVNLVSTGGINVNYWDAPPKVSNTVSGGTGTWVADGSNTNWTDAKGQINASWSPGEFAIFMANPGTVTVSNAGGDVTAQGMQFAVGGYEVTGDPITLVNTANTSYSVIRVGDGTAASAAMTATISAALQGDAGLVKEDYGTLVLSGTNLYTGGTYLMNGTLQIASDANLGSAGMNLRIANNSTLATTESFTMSRPIVLMGTADNPVGGIIDTKAGTTLTVSGVISDITFAGSLTKAGDGTLVLTNENFYTGGTTIAAGTLALGNGGTSGSILGDVVNSATLSFNRSDSVIFGGIISGSGALEQNGSGTTILTADNSYSGGTTIQSGTLALGNGATSGSISGDVTNGGTLAFNRTDLVTFNGVISDCTIATCGTVSAGSVVQKGSGTTILTADNTYSGTTTIQSGWLYINGDQSAATGVLTAQAGTRLGGSGTLGGNVLMAAGSTLAPGAAPTLPGTLTINGDLTLNANSSLFYNLGQAGVAGGPLNDLTVVKGNLDLAGTLNLAYNGEPLEPGVYRLFDYGSLSCGGAACTGSNGLAIGDYLTAPTSPQGTANVVAPLNDPANPAFSVQTSIAGQVNLVNTGGLSLNYWDGENGGKNDSQITGGDGKWSVGSGAPDNWTNSGGSANAPWTKGFAIFTGTGGTVAVDNSGGAVTTQGMQFAVDGYRVVANSPGDVLTLENTGSTPYSVIRVGDGTAESANMTAVIDVPLVGAAGLVKEDYGTLVLSGTNLYSGGTYLMNGTLQIASDANLGSAGMNLRIANNSTLATTDSFTMSRPIVLMGTADNPVGGIIDTRAGTTLTVSGVISDITFAATLTKAGDGTLVLTNDNLYTGGTVIAAGTLQLGSGGTSGSILGDVANSATLSFNRSDAVIFAGTISGSGALLQNGSGTTILTADNTYSGGTTIQSGTLQLGNGGTSGSIIGNISNGGTLAFNRADAFTFNGVISDCTIATCGAVSAGSVVQKGSGTTILTADSTYSGGTTIQSGTLQLGNGGTSGSITGDVANNGTLSFNRSGTYIFGGVVSGSGAVVQKGSGTTILTGDSSYSGGTTIATGTLQLGNGGTSGSITGDVVNQGVLSFSRSSDITFAGQVSGAGALSQIGGGTTSLTANSSYSGGTTIQSGTLQLGNGGTSGSITGDVVNNATLGFNHSDLLVLMGTISGAGNMVQSGSGDTALYGDNSYSGTTTVSSGGLYINGSQSGNGLTTVNVGGTLGGTGTLGGPVTVAGTLAPGNVGVLPGTLTINGDLILQSGSTLSYDFGQAYVVGGPLNDLTVVNGNLQLGGTIDVTETLGGSFAAGIYRVIDYSGNLSGSLDRSTRVAGLGLEVQTSVPQQVNLVNTNGLVLNFWDLNPDNSVIDGAGTQGTGDWKLGDSVKNWTDLIGSYNGTFTNGTIAIFTATPGTVMVDNGQGQVKAGGMQFASSGYVVSGQALELVPGDSSSNAAVIRVGDGSSDGALMTATINAALIGSAQLMKTDLGTLVLTGSNSYSGGTAIEGGTLQVGEDANLGAAGTSVDFNGGTLHATAGFSMARNSMLAALGGTMAVDGGAVLEDNGTISGEGALTKSGEGTLVLGSANSYSGGTALNGGTLLLGNANALGSGTLTMAGATVLDFADSYTIANGINLAGIGGINVHDALTTTLAGVIGDGEGAGLLQKTGSGTLVLTGSNSYSGGTAINGGVLEVSQNVNLGASGGAVAFDGGTLHVTAAFAMVRDFVLNAGGAVLDTDAGVVLQNDGALTGAGGLTKTGAGSLALSGPASYSGATVVDQGLLRAVAENVLSPNSAVTVNAAAVLDLGGHSQAVAALTNSGMVTMGANTAAGAVLTVGGNYVGNGGTLMFNTLLAGDNSPSDRMVVAGSASGTSQVSITRAGGLGALTTGNGIELIAVNGVSDPGAFRLQGRVAAGTYEYMLFMGGIGADAGNQNWYLRSELACRRLPRSGECASAPEPIYRPEVMVDSAMAGLASRFGLGMLGTWHERSGGEFGTSYSRVEGANQAAWARLFGNAGNVGGNSGDSSDRAAAFDRHGPSYDYGFAGIQAGMDVWRRDNRDGSRDTAGLYLGAGNARADVNGEVDFGRGSRAGQLTLNGYSFGGYYTHVGRSGWYVDVVAQGTRYDHIRATSNIEDPQTLASGGWGWVVSGEGGTPIHLARGFILEPQAQLVYQHMGFANGSDAFGRINFSDSDALFGRIGARVARDFALADGRKVTAWMRASLWSAFGAQATTTFSSLDGSNPTPVRTDLGGNWSQFDLGLEAQVNRSLAVFANASYNVSFTQGQGWGGRGGVKLSW